MTPFVLPRFLFLQICDLRLTNRPVKGDVYKRQILRRHLLEKVPVSDLCAELGLRPTVFCRWQKEFFENGAAAFQAQERPHRQVEEKQERIGFLEKKVQTKDEGLAELMAEPVALKKPLGKNR